MPTIHSIASITNLNPNGTFRSTSVELRVTNTTASPLAPIIVNAYNSPGAAANVGGAPATLFFTTTFQINDPNGVVKLIIPSTVESFIIRVQSPTGAIAPEDVEVAAQGRDKFGNFVPEHAFSLGDWFFVANV